MDYGSILGHASQRAMEFLAMALLRLGQTVNKMLAQREYRFEG